MWWGEMPYAAYVALLAARAPASAPAAAALLLGPPIFFRCNLPLPPSGAAVLPLCRTGVLPGLGISESAISEPSVLPTTSTASSPFSSLTQDSTLSGRLKTRGEGVLETRPGLDRLSSGSPSLPPGGYFRFFPLVFFPCCSCAFSACLARTGESRRRDEGVCAQSYAWCTHIPHLIIYSHLVSISSSSRRRETISFGFRASGLKSAPEITIRWICRVSYTNKTS